MYCSFGPSGKHAWMFAADASDRSNIIIYDPKGGYLAGRPLSAAMDLLDNAPKAAGVHQVSKPVGLMDIWMRRFCMKDQLVISLFSGHGADVHAAVALGIDVLAVERDYTNFKKLCDGAVMAHTNWLKQQEDDEKKRLRRMKSSKKGRGKKAKRGVSAPDANLSLEVSGEEDGDGGDEEEGDAAPFAAPRPAEEKEDPNSAPCVVCFGSPQPGVPCVVDMVSNICARCCVVVASGNSDAEHNKSFCCSMGCAKELLLKQGGWLKSTGHFLQVNSWVSLCPLSVELQYIVCAGFEVPLNYHTAVKPRGYVPPPAPVLSSSSASSSSSSSSSL
jgi:hypothetical protein